MKTAFAYARIDKNNGQDKSIREQFKNIEKYASNHAYKILNRYYDTDNGHYDKKSIGFGKMIKDALAFAPNVILFEDGSVLEINEAGIKQALINLQEKGVRLCTISSAEKNEVAVSERQLEKSFESSLQESENKLRVTESNIEAEQNLSVKPSIFENMETQTSEILEKELAFRDQKSGYMFKKPGKVPFGYRSEIIQIVDSKNNKVYSKYVWVLDEEQAELLRVMVVELYTKRRMSYNEIKKLLNDKGIKSPQKKIWGTSSVASLLSEERLRMYSGQGVLKDERFLGEKRIEHAHPALISKDELQQVLARKEENRKTAQVGRSKKGQFLYTGLNFENEAIFKCEACGSRVIGYQNSSDKWFKYVCSAYRSQGMNGCSNSWRLDREWLENSILNGICKKFLTEDAKNQFFMDIPKTLRASFKHLNIEKRVLTDRLEQCDLEGRRLLTALKGGMTAELLTEEIDSLNREKEKLKRKLKRTEEDIEELSIVDEKGLRNIFDSFELLYEQLEGEDKRRLARLFVRQIRMLPENRKIKVEFNNPTVVLKHFRDYETMYKRFLIQLKRLKTK